MAVQLTDRVAAPLAIGWGHMADLIRSPMWRGAFLALSVRVASAGVLYASQVLLARWMGDTGYGIYVSAWAWVLLLGGTAHLGAGLAMLRLVPELNEHGDWARLRGLLIISRIVPLIAGSLVAAVGLAIVHLTATAANVDWTWALTCALLAVPAHALTEVNDGIGRGKGWFATALIPPYIIRPILIVAGLGALEVAVGPLSATCTAATALASTWTIAAMQTVLIEARLRSVVPLGPRRFELRSWLAGALPLLALGGCDLAIQNIDVMVVSQVVAPAAAGVYFAASKTMALIQFINYAVGSAVAYRFASLNARRDQLGLRATFREAVNLTFWPSLAGSIAILALGGFLLRLFGPAFSDGWPVMLVLSIGFLARAALGPADVLLNAVGAQRWTAVVLACGAGLDLLLNPILAHHFGLLGAATATSIALVVVAIGNAVVARAVVGFDVGIWANTRWLHTPQVVAKYRTMISS